jgi:hypothetical protein
VGQPVVGAIVVETVFPAWLAVSLRDIAVRRVVVAAERCFDCAASAIAGPGSQGTVTLGMAVLSQGENRQDVLPPNESRRPRASRAENPGPDDAVFLGGGARLNARFHNLSNLAGIKPRNIETSEDESWVLKDLRKTCATYYDEHVPESSIEILVYSVGGITYRHYAHRAPLAFKAIMTISQPTAFSTLIKGFVGECPCCRRRFADAQ